MRASMCPLDGVKQSPALVNAGQVALGTGIYNSGTVTALPALPGATAPAIPLAINDTGQVAEYAVDSGPNVASAGYGRHIGM